MRLSEIKAFLSTAETMPINLPDGTRVPTHFHVTEVGQVTRKFIDCGGTLREESIVNLQLWSSYDYNHRLHPGKLVSIIELAERQLGLEDLEIEVEYQGADSIVKYGLEVRNGELHLTGKQTACLALEECGLPGKAAATFTAIAGGTNCCTPGGGCC